MKRNAVSLLLFTVTLLLATYAESAFRVQDRHAVQDSYYRGCMDREQATSTIKLRDEFIHEICSCTAAGAIEYIESNATMMAAYARGDEKAYQAELNGKATIAKFTEIQNACVQAITKAQGGASVLAPGDQGKLNAEKGLSGRLRKDMVASTEVHCFAGQRADQANKYLSDLALNQMCNCTANYVADRVSEVELVTSIKTGKPYESPKGATYNKGLQYCAKKILK